MRSMHDQVPKASRARGVASRARTLPVAPVVGTPRMRTAAGDPIWPYGDADTLAALTRIAELFGASMAHERPCGSVAFRVARRRGTVMSVGAETRDVALLYAHLTNRRFEAARNTAVLE